MTGGESEEERGVKKPAIKYSDSDDDDIKPDGLVPLKDDRKSESDNDDEDSEEELSDKDDKDSDKDPDYQDDYQ